MNRIYGFAACGIAVALLAACGKSSEVSDGAASASPSALSTSPVALASQADALRELNIATALAWQVSGGAIGINAGGANAERVRAWSFNGGERAGAQLADGSDGGTQKGKCKTSGSYESTQSAGSHTFTYFAGRSENVAVTRNSRSQCKSEWSANSVTQSLTLGGIEESGQNAAADYSYGTLGAGSDAYTERYENKSSKDDAVDVSFLGSSEAHTPPDGPLQAAAVFRYRYKKGDGDFFSADVGDGSAPFTVEQGGTLSIAGPYSYAYKDVGGGQATVSTPVAVQLDGSGAHPSAGEIKIVSGSHEALFTFASDGGATLKLDDSTLALSAADIQTALKGAPPSN